MRPIYICTSISIAISKAMGAREDLPARMRMHACIYVKAGYADIDMHVVYICMSRARIKFNLNRYAVHIYAHA